MKTIIKLLIIFALFISCEKEQTLIKVESQIKYMSYVELYYYKVDGTDTKIELINFWLDAYDKRTLSAKPGRHQYSYAYYIDSVRTYYSQAFDLMEGETYKIIIHGK